MAAIVTAASSRAGYGVPAVYAPVGVPAHGQQPEQPPETVPETVVDRRKDELGNIVIRRYKRGRILGKVCPRKPYESAING